MKDWTEDFEHENGQYQNLCRECNSIFIGYKRRLVCKECMDKKQVSVEPVKPEIAEEKLRELFRNNSDCYADTWQFQNDGSVKEGAVTQAMTEDKFIEIVRKQFAV